MNLIHGDCLEKLKELPDNSIDSIVTDPPYHLTSIVKRFGKPNSAPAQYGTDGAFSRASKGFMGKEWDGGDIAQRPDVWIECLRVLKPGGHMIAFSGSRTYHRMAVAIEDAGFDIRDQIMWIYGSGFPKSHNIGKAVDKLLGNEREVIGEVKDGFNNWAQFTDRDWKPENNVYTKGQSEWEGWGTALKPAHEPIVVARKPLSEKSVAENVLKWGTGGLNIDDSRIEYKDDKPIGRDCLRDKTTMTGWGSGGLGDRTEDWEPNNTGRWPANIILDEGEEPWRKFFYCPKTSKKDRDEGLDNFEEYTSGKNGRGLDRMCSVCGTKMVNQKDCVCENPNWIDIPKKNHHPTVKPISLMEYLIKLVTPKGGTVCDPFMGSGSTGKAAIRGGFDFVGIEKEEEYIKIAEARINNEIK